MAKNVVDKIVLEFTEVVPLAEVEKKYIELVLLQTQGNKTKAHRLLGISLKTLYNKLALWETKVEESKNDGENHE